MTDVEERRLNAEEKRTKEKEREEWVEKLKPTDWELCFDDADQHYFYNTVTGTSSWDLDVDKEVEYALVSASMNQMNRLEEQKTEQGTVGGGAGGSENWEEQLTDAGDKYFYNVVTGESSWTAPV